MKAKSIINFSLAMILSFFSIISFASVFIPNAAQAMLPDDEKEEFRNCTGNPEKVQIFCTEGIIDCRPRDC